MKLTALRTVQVPGRGVVSRGETIVWEGAIPAHFIGNFKKEDGTRLTEADPPEAREATKPDEATDGEDVAALIEKTARLGVKKLCALLDSHNALYDAKASAAELAKTYLRATGVKVD